MTLASPPKRTLGIIGTGLIGGSIGMRARRDGALVVGYDVDAGMLAAALEVGAIDFAATRDELYARAGTFVIAAHLDATVVEIERLRTEGPIRATLVLDIASVKVPVVVAARGLENFVATHPMAGSQRSGVRAGRANLFDGRTWAYVPSGDAQLDARARAFIGSLGAIPLLVDAEEHDRIVAFTSHLPQLIASSYAGRAQAKRCESFDALCGATARELLRLGDSGFTMWRDILRANAANVEPELRELGTRLIAAADALAAGDVDALSESFPVETAVH
jgi:prephenate dehydrogenase